ncbi:reverse transcriptase domain-containing protein [Tanacetum coccineum]
MGHLSKNCQSKKPATRSNQLPVIVVCHACGEKGHYTNQCQKTKLNVQEVKAYIVEKYKNAQQTQTSVTGLESYTNATRAKKSHFLLHLDNSEPQKKNYTTYDLELGAVNIRSLTRSVETLSIRYKVYSFH